MRALFPSDRRLGSDGDLNHGWGRVADHTSIKLVMLILYAGRYRFSPANAAIAQESRLTEKELEDYMVSLDRDTGPTAYLFRCGSCGSWGGYSDTH